MRNRLAQVVSSLSRSGTSEGHTDPWLIVQRGAIRLNYLQEDEVPADLCSLHTAGEIFLSVAVQADELEHRKALFHALAHVAIARAANGSVLFPELEPEFAKMTTELMASQVEGAFAIPAAGLLTWRLANPAATIFDGAIEFGVELHFFTRRVAETIHGFWTGDRRYDKPSLRKLVERCTGRVDVVRQQRIDEFLERDPRILSDDLINPDARDLLELFRRFARLGNEEAARHILLMLRQTSSKTLCSIVEHQSLSDTKALLAAFDLLPEGEARLARAIFFQKLGGLDAAERELSDLSQMGKETAADAHAVLGRIRKLKGDHRGAIKECQIALELDPSNGEAIGGEINARISLGQSQQVLQLLEPLKETELRAMYFEGKLAEKEGRPGDAITSYLEVTKSQWHPFFRKALARLAAVYAALDWDAKALTLYGLTNLQFPQDAETLAGFVPVLLRNDRYAEAVRLLLDATRNVVIQGWAFRMLGEVYSRAGMPDLAQAFWDQADLLEPAGGSQVA
jgi:tetratricopeptide (TPR) repeat protein